MQKIFVMLLLCYTFVVQAQPLREAQLAFQVGHFERAITQWQTILATTQNVEQRLVAWLGIIKASQRLGHYEKAFNTLNVALPLAKQTSHDGYHVLLLNEQSKISLSQGERHYETALEQAEVTLKMARKLKNPLILVNVLRHWGNILAVEYDFEEAIEVYREALAKIPEISPSLSLPKEGTQEISSSSPKKGTLPFSQAEIEALAGKILISLAQPHFLLETEDDQTFENTQAVLEQALQATQKWQQATYSRILALITLSQIAQKLQAQVDESIHSHIAYQALKHAQKMAKQLNNTAAKAFSYGQLGQLYRQAKRYQEAFALTRQAIFFAQQTRQQSFLYFWQWQLARIQNAQGDKEGAIASYRQAIGNFRTVHAQIATTGYTNITETFRDKIAPIYFELADLLLQKARNTTAGSTRQTLLQEARKTVEIYKEAELQNYFQTDCMTLGEDCVDMKQVLDAQTAILYPIPLADRLEIILERHDGLVQAMVPVGEKQLRHKIADFLMPLRNHPNFEELSRNRSQRAALGQEPEAEICQPMLRGTQPQKIQGPANTFWNPAQTLYSWLIEPLAEQLAGIQTLVIIPDGALRTMPFSALHDGQQFLIQKYALSILPGLCLKEANILPAQQKNTLLGGLSKPVLGFSSLPCAQYEVGSLKVLLDNTSIPLFNETFTFSNVKSNITKTNYSVMHIASHGQFSGTLEKTFVLMFEDKLTMDRLEHLVTLTSVGNKQPLELLTLSACETAVGDDRAALGLAGVALKAGAKTALASLWKVDDEATPAVVIEFYRQLQIPGITKAKALQAAQNLILTDKNYTRYRHPYFWSAFMLIGQWF
jgi:CHAT domain-containing protein